MKTQKITELIQTLRNLFPGSEVQLTVGEYPALNIFQVPTYDTGCAIMRELGVQKWDKRVFGNDSSPWVLVYTRVENFDVKLYCHTLPPTCHIEEYVEKIPKEKTITTDEFIEVKRTRVICGGGE